MKTSPKKKKPGRPRKTRGDANLVQQKILDAAETVFAKKGVNSSGLREIATLSGHSLALVTYYFKTKERLAIAVFERHLQNHQSAVNEALSRQQGQMTPESLTSVLKEVMKWYGSEAGLKAHRMQLSADLDATEKLEATSKDFLVRSIGLGAETLRHLNPKLDEAESLERSLFLLMLMRIRTDLHWVYAENTGQKKAPKTVVQNYENWLLGSLLKTLIYERLE